MHITAHIVHLLLLALFVLGTRGGAAKYSKLLEELHDESRNNKDHNKNAEKSITKAIKAFDTNKDQGIDLEELAVVESLIKIVPQAAGVWDDEKDYKLRHLKESLFAMVDADADGHVTADELKGGCFAIVAVLDYVGGGQVPPEALCRLAASVCGDAESGYPVKLEQRTKVAFEFQDENSDGKITGDEFANTRFTTGIYWQTHDGQAIDTTEQTCEAVAAAATTAAQLQAKFVEADGDGNGVLSAKEYKAYITISKGF